MGNTTCTKRVIPCFRVEPIIDAPTRESVESECKNYRVPWDGAHIQKPEKSEPCCFCWCFLCTCSCKTGNRYMRNKRRPSTIESENRLYLRESLNSDKVRKWMIDFESLINDEVGKLLFERFLQQEHSEENLKFWLEVERMKSTQDSTKRYILIQRIYREFIEPRASNEINVESWVRKAVQSKLKDPDADIFEPAQSQVYLLMYRQSWPRFLASGIFQNVRLYVKT